MPVRPVIYSMPRHGRVLSASGFFSFQKFLKMTKHESKRKQVVPPPDAIRALKALESLSVLYQNVIDWILEYHHENDSFCETLEKLYEVCQLEREHVSDTILPYSQKEWDKWDPESKNPRSDFFTSQTNL